MIKKALILFVLMLPLQVLAQTQLAIPLASQGQWQLLEYRGIAANQVTFTDNGMTITVNNSASPLIYPLAPDYFSSLHYTMQINGKLNLKPDLQGSTNNDDFLLRIGVVYEGNKTLNFIERKLAAGWIKTLFKLAPKGTGVDKIEFFNIYSDPHLANQTRVHPLSEYMQEHFLLAEVSNGHYQGQIELNTEKRVLGIWLSADGDDTESGFEVVVTELELSGGN